MLILTHEFPPHIFGGIGTFCSELAAALARRNLDVTVVAGCPPSAIGAKYPRDALLGNVHVLRLPRVDFPPNHLWFQLMSLDKLRKLVCRFDIVHGQDSSSFPLIYFSKRMNPELPWVVTVHDGPISELQYVFRSLGRGGGMGDLLRYGMGFPAWDATLRGDLKYADAIVPVSEGLSTEIRNCYPIDPKKLSTIHTGVDIQRLEDIAQEYTKKRRADIASNKVSLLWAGRLSWRKGIVHLLKSVWYLVDEIGFGDFELQVFGRGPLEHRVRELVSRLNLTSNVILRGFVKYEELIASLVASDIVCFPSLYEACPVGMIEAMALGKPVIAFDRPFSRELVGNDLKSSLASDVIEYSRILHRLCTHEGLREEIGKRLQMRARQNFDINLIAKQYSELYQDVLAGG